MVAFQLVREPRKAKRAWAQCKRRAGRSGELSAGSSRRRKPMAKFDGQNSAETAPICMGERQHGAAMVRKPHSNKSRRYRNHPSNVAMRDALGRLGLSVARFSDLIGKPERTVKDWSRGAARPTQEAMVLLSMIEGLAGARDWLEARHPREVKPRGRPFKRKPRR
jgi:DNA-binding transcriptional regulator YiaG